MEKVLDLPKDRILAFCWEQADDGRRYKERAARAEIQEREKENKGSMKSI